MASFKNNLLEISDTIKDEFETAFIFPKGEEKRVVEAMKYSVLNGGKRLRPFLVINTANLFGVKVEYAIRTAAALEMIHSYSLIHDDLPAMDDDVLRRGNPTCHVKFDEATAILAGDGLLTYAFEYLADEKTHDLPEVRCELVKTLANAAGAFTGMVAGQMLDLYAEKIDHKDEQLILDIQRMKTGRLIKFAVEAGAILGGANEIERRALTNYSEKIGLAFQITDDILDVEGDEKKVGKTLRKDDEQGKVTYVSLWGLDRAKNKAKELIESAISDLSIFEDRAVLLNELAQYILRRNH